MYNFLHVKLAADLGLAFTFTPAIGADRMIQKGFVSKCVELMCSLVWLCGIRKPRKCSSKWTAWHAAMLLLLQLLTPCLW